jgi:hypothetical protein
MNFELFESMTPEEAKDHLEGFLATERVALQQMEPAAKAAGIALDYSLATLPAFLKWLTGHLHIVRVPVPESEPDWVRNYHKDGFITFTDESKYLILRAAYYLGECFVRSNKALRWAVGNPEFIEKNMPVVTGFRFDKELAPMMVCENLFMRILGDGAPSTHFDTMVDSWRTDMP